MVAYKIYATKFTLRPKILHAFQNLHILRPPFFIACKKDDTPAENFPKENASLFEEVGSIDIGDVVAAELTAFDPLTKRLFVVNNGSTNKIDIIDLSNPSSPSLIGNIPWRLMVDW